MLTWRPAIDALTFAMSSIWTSPVASTAPSTVPHLQFGLPVDNLP
jgi:hypothetical protein